MRVEVVRVGDVVQIVFSAPAALAQFAFELEDAKTLAARLNDCAQPLAKSVDNLDLSVRAANCLDALGIRTVAELVMKSSTELMKQRHLGRKVVKEIRTELGKLGLKLKGDK